MSCRHAERGKRLVVVRGPLFVEQIEIAGERELDRRFLLKQLAVSASVLRVAMTSSPARARRNSGFSCGAAGGFAAPGAVANTSAMLTARDGAS
jgi:hypothetical protein